MGSRVDRPPGWIGHHVVSLSRCPVLLAIEMSGFPFKVLCGADQREAEYSLKLGWFCLCIGPLSLVPVKSSERPAAVKGARFLRGGGKSFPVLKRFSGAHP